MPKNARPAAAVAPVVANAKPTVLQTLQSWHRTIGRTNSKSVEFGNHETVFAALADYSTAELARLAGFLQSVSRIHHADFEMTDAEKAAEAEAEAAVRRKRDEEREERNLTNRARAERDAREAAAEVKVDLAVFAPELDADDRHYLFPAHVVALPTAKGGTYRVRWTDETLDQREADVPFVVAASERAHRQEEYRVPTDAQVAAFEDFLNPPAPVVVKKGPTPRPTQPAAKKVAAAVPASTAKAAPRTVKVEPVVAKGPKKRPAGNKR